MTRPNTNNVEPSSASKRNAQEREAVITLFMPRGRADERVYAARTTLLHILGVDGITLAADQGEAWGFRDADSRSLTLPDVFFPLAERDWLLRLPAIPTPVPRHTFQEPWLQGSGIEPELPILFADRAAGAPLIEGLSHAMTLHLDVFGAAFFFLTRYEEVVCSARDSHDRFPAAASLAHQQGFLDRPIIDEYASLLWACLKRIWPSIPRRARKSRVFATHDVDHPLSNIARAPAKLLRNMAGDMVRRRSLALARQRISAFFCAEPARFEHDPNNTFDFLMDVSERYNLCSAFYFKAGATSREYDDDYSLEMPWIRQLLQRITDRGHEIGLHPSYNTYLDASQLRREFGTLLRAAENCGVKQHRWGGRQHYLRWRAPTTWRNWEAAGLAYDSTLGYADYVGFRCGTSHPYPAFDIESGREMQLIERPLLAMDCALYGWSQKHVRRDVIADATAGLWRRVDKNQGEFVILAHNNFVCTENYRRLFRWSLECAAG